MASTTATTSPKAADLDGFVRALAGNPEHDDKSLKWFLRRAHRRVWRCTASRPANLPPHGEGRRKPARGPRHPDLSAVPKTLAGVPGSDGPGDLDGDEFSELDKLEGEAYDEAYAKLSKASRNAIWPRAVGSGDMAEALVSTPSRKWVDLHPGDRLVAGSVEVQMVHKTGRVAGVRAGARRSLGRSREADRRCATRPIASRHDKVGSARSG